MGIIAVSIEMEVPWRGRSQGFGNRYLYNTEALGNVTEEEAERVVDRLVEIHRPVHSTAVKFVHGRLWEYVHGNTAASKMIFGKPLSGTGSAPASASFNREFAMLVQWPLGRYGANNHPQFLRKWIHTCSELGTTIPSEAYAGTGTFTPPIPLNTYAAAVHPLVVSLVNASPFELVSPIGKQPVGPFKVHPYLEHRQFGR